MGFLEPADDKLAACRLLRPGSHFSPLPNSPTTLVYLLRSPRALAGGKGVPGLSRVSFIFFFLLCSFCSKEGRRSAAPTVPHGLIASPTRASPPNQRHRNCVDCSAEGLALQPRSTRQKPRGKLIDNADGSAPRSKPNPELDAAWNRGARHCVLHAKWRPICQQLTATTTDETDYLSITTSHHQPNWPSTILFADRQPPQHENGRRSLLPLRYMTSCSYTCLQSLFSTVLSLAGKSHQIPHRPAECLTTTQ